MTENEIRRQLIEARDEYIRTIKSEIMGPGSEFSVPDAEHELISARPDSRYSVGILFPQGNNVNQDNGEAIPDSPSDEGEEDSVGLSDDPDVSQEQPQSKTSHSPAYETNEPTGENPDEEIGLADENLDEEIGMASQYMQSSMGITFLVKGDTSHVFGSAKFATYRAAKVTDCIIPYRPAEPDTYVLPPGLGQKMVYDKELQCVRLLSQITWKEAKEIFERDTIPEAESSALKEITFRFADYCRTGYVREPHEIESFELDFTQDDYVEDERNKKLDNTTAKIVALRTQVRDDIWSVTVMLVNGLEESPAKSCHCIFQSRITISTQNNDFVFIESIPQADMDSMDDEEEKALALLYRHKKIYGTGLGTSVDWDIDDSGHGSIWSEFFPVREIPSMSFSLPENTSLTDRELSMKYLSDLSNASKEQQFSSLTALVDLYKSWVDGISEIAQKLDPQYQTAATRNITDCRRAYERMYSGIETLKTDKHAYSAFLLANRAMFMQRVHLKMQADMANEDRYDDDEEIAERLLSLNYCTEPDDNAIWRPFQIAFLLMDINSIVSDTSGDRNIVDLIWFPTGGGKTEAYLGLTAFTIFYRKLKHLQESGGTAVIMRYTLRLLAAQQFTRAATLICACEYIREDSLAKKPKYPVYLLGKEPITIGLWIGGDHTPNSNKEATDDLKELGNSNAYSVRIIKEKYNKFQVLKCPWCGTKMVMDAKDDQLVGAWGYLMERGHFSMHCPHEECHFNYRLPIQIIDEELYNTPPTLLFGTVDKFAMLPWDGRIGAFFAVGSENRTPELIIQDELHLISGALGTMVGLYETAVDALCSQKGIRPKIIASTATIRKAKEQCSVLYNRDVMQFPAPGIDAEDSFFAKEAPMDYENGSYGRKYIGIMPSGKTKAMTEIRLMAAMLQRTAMLDLPYAVKDKFWTLAVYFNSLRDLGIASTLVKDNVKDFVKRTGNRVFKTWRRIIATNELTSRVSTTELNETLDNLEKVEYSEENRAANRYASDILLATNMISVGIDIPRLNAMLMIGQPKLTSEYIQASSRVGRDYPGAVFVQYDATKSRDRSHYERFRSYHGSYYRFVEPTGATPFSRPARERALHAVLTAMIRFTAGWVRDDEAGNFNSEYHQNVIKEVKQYIIKRIEEINNRAKNGTREDLSAVGREIQEFIETWQSLAADCAAMEEKTPLYFGRRFMVTPPGSEKHRLLKPYNSPGLDPALNTLTSMRNVDKYVPGEIIVWEED